MSTLPTNLRRQLESAIKEARNIARGALRRRFKLLRFMSRILTSIWMKSTVTCGANFVHRPNS